MPVIGPFPRRDPKVCWVRTRKGPFYTSITQKTWFSSQFCRMNLYLTVPLLKPSTVPPTLSTNHSPTKWTCWIVRCGVVETRGVGHWDNEALTVLYWRVPFYWWKRGPLLAEALDRSCETKPHSCVNTFLSPPLVFNPATSYPTS